jgi:hypothetical protein
MLNNDFVFGVALPLSAIIDAVKNESHQGQSFCVYSKDASGSLTASGECFLEAYPVVDDSDREIFPEFVRKNRLELAFYGEQFEDVIRNVVYQKQSADTKDFVEALNFYMENDNFMDF